MKPRRNLNKLDGLWTVYFEQGTNENELNDSFTKIVGDYYVLSNIEMLDSIQSIYHLSNVFTTEDGDTLYEGNQIVVGYKNSTTAQQIEDIEDNFGLTIIKTTGFYSLYSADSVIETASQIYETDKVEFSHPNFIFHPKSTYIPNDAYFNKQFYLHNTGQIINDNASGTVDADMDVPEAWDITKGSSSVVTAVIDRGITSNHPDLPNTRQVRLPGGNLSAQMNNSNPNDLSPNGHYHGDPCAGIIAAEQNNSIGISGIAPLTKIMPVKFESGATPAIFADCIAFADNNGANIISGSFSTPSKFPVLEAAVDNAINNGIMLFFAAGNTRYNTFKTSNPQLFPSYNPAVGDVEAPANSSNPLVITVGASDINNQLAWYSPINEGIDVVAPSSTSISDDNYTFQTTANTINIWSMDIPGLPGINPFPTGDSFVPQGEILPNTGQNNLAFTSRFGGTSAATPMVAGVAALALSANPCISNIQMKDVLINTADKVGNYNYNWSSTKPGHSKEMGYGRVNANKAVLAAQELYSSTLDLMIKDVPQEFGAEPDIVAQYLYLSEDIWVRNQPNGITNQFHEDPIYDPSNPVYVYVRIRNKSCVDALAGVNENVTLYWSKAATALSWPDHWDRSITSPALMGEPIGTQPIGNIKAGDEKILVSQWYPPDPNNYTSNTQPWHFCLLARIVSNNDPMTYPEVSTLWKNVKNNNNIAWKNLEIIRKSQIVLSEPQLGLGGVIAIGNDEFGSPKTIDLKFEESTLDFGNPLYEDAEITIHLDEVAFQKWLDGGQEMVGMQHIEVGIFRITNETAFLKNMTFSKGERATLYLGVNFLTDEIGEKVFYRYHVEEYESGAGREFIGGEQYLIHRDERDIFYADAGTSESINQGESVQLNTISIGEDATYNWYDESGNLIFSGTDTIIIPDSSGIFKLEVIAHADGFKDYDEKTIEVKNNYIESVNPNPSSAATNQVTVNYKLNNVSLGNLILSNSTYTISSNYSINPSQNSITLDIASLPAGAYSISLACDGIIKDVKLFTKN